MPGKLSKILTRLVYPDGLCCVSCDAELFKGDDKVFCKKCLPNKNEQYCWHCGAGLPNSTQGYCNSCLYIDQEKLYFDSARAPYLYQDEGVKFAIHHLKYNNDAYLAEIFAKDMVEMIMKQNWQIDTVTYVPLHWRKEQLRGYNQSKLLASHIAKALDLPLVNALKKTSYSRKSATKLGRDERRKLLDGTFALTKENITGKNILLVDDVMTSKATANECSKMLKQGNARNIYVITYATGRGDGQQTY